MANSYVLYLSQRSPFARRIRLALSRFGLKFDERMLNVFEPTPDFIAANPLGMVPTLVTPDCGTLFDSAAILEYLDEKTGRVWPKEFKARTEARLAATLAEGAIHHTVLYFLETHEHEVPSQKWAQDHWEVIERSLERISISPKSWWIQDGALTQAGWDTAVALEYLDLRVPTMKWNERWPALKDTLELARKNSFFLETKPKL